MAVFAAAGWLLFQRASDTTSVLVIARAVPVGGRLTAADLAVAQAKADPGLQLIAARDEPSVIGQVASVGLRPGATLSLSELGGPTTPSAGDQIVGMALKPGFLPSRTLQDGDRVDLDAAPAAVGSGSATSTGASAAPVQAVVTGVGHPDSSGVVVVDVEVPNQVAPAVAAESAAGQLVLTLLPATP